MNNLLVALTFVYGVIRLLTFTKLFNSKLVGIMESVLPNLNSKKPSGHFFLWIDYLTFYGSLVIQTYYWLFLYK